MVGRQPKKSHKKGMTIVSALAFPFLIVERDNMGITKEKAVEVAIREGKFYKAKLAKK